MNIWPIQEEAELLNYQFIFLKTSSSSNLFHLIIYFILFKKIMKYEKIIEIQIGK
jgi:hypothetical protein